MESLVLVKFKHTVIYEGVTYPTGSVKHITPSLLKQLTIDVEILDEPVESGVAYPEDIAVEPVVEEEVIVEEDEPVELDSTEIVPEVEQPKELNKVLKPNNFKKK